MVYESLLLKSILEDAFAKREKTYLKVLSMAKLSLKTGLKLLGIEAKEIM